MGNYLLNDLVCTINYNTNTLKIQTLHIPLQFIQPVYTMPPRTEIVIECSISNPQIIEGVVADQNISDSILIANCITRVKSNNRINITVINTSEEPVTINSDLQLNLEPIDTNFMSAVSHSFPKSNVTKRTHDVLNQLRTTHLNLEETQALKDTCSKYSDIFHLPDDQLTRTPALEHQIKLNDDCPINTKTYRFPEFHKQEVHSQMNKMLKDGIIKPSMSPWSAPIWVVPKKLDASGQRKWRVVVDYRKLNDVTIGDTYPIPQISEILDQLGKSKYFSTLDLASGFNPNVY